VSAARPLVPLLAEAFERSLVRNAQVRLPGADRDLLVSVVMMTDGDTVMGAIVVLRDLESIRTLSSLVTYSTKLAELGALTSGVAHEVKNPLNAMMIHLEVLRGKLDGQPDDARASLDVIGAEIRRLDRVVQGFLRFVRHEELTLKPIDLNALLMGIGALLEPEAKKRGILLAFDLTPGLPPVHGDEDMLRQVFVNLVQNAYQAMAGEGVVTLTTARESDWISAEVTDEGVGIPSEAIDKIFKLYYTTKPDGNGLGLSVVYRIVQAHDGTIDVVSNVGKGTTMTVRLPARDRSDRA
jgi:signal transduction histidine kinase